MMNFSQALEALKQGQCVARPGWSQPDKSDPLGQRLRRFLSIIDGSLSITIPYPDRPEILRRGGVDGVSILAEDWVIVDPASGIPVIPEGNS